MKLERESNWGFPTGAKRKKRKIGFTVLKRSVYGKPVMVLILI
jgi:hypothetical protein